MIDGQNFFDKPVKNNLITYDNTRKIATGQGDDYTTGCLLDYNYFNNYYKMTQYNALIIKLSNSQPGDSNDENNFLHKLFQSFVKLPKMIHQLI